MTAEQFTEALFEQFQQDVLNARAAARRLKDRQRLEEEEHGNEETYA